MYTVEYADDLQLVASLALQVQMKTKVTPQEGEDEAGTVLVHADSEPLWIRPWEITSFAAWTKGLVVWRGVRPSQSTPGCLQLSDPEFARVRYNV